MPFMLGEVYRRTDIQDEYGGQQQGRISTPANHPYIFIFSSDSGENYGYQDHWNEDQTHFYYTGEGQVGDMEFIRGNRAIRDHSQNGKSIYLFFYVRPAYVQYHGEMNCVDYEIIRTHDRERNTRDAIRFILENKTEAAPAVMKVGERTPRYNPPNKTERQGLVTSRVGQGYYRQEIINKFDGKCAVTGCNLKEILIASHIVPWRDCTDDERLDVENGLLLSPNYDALFDKHLISFDEDGKLIKSDLLSDEELDNLFIVENVKIVITDGMQKYLESHREALR